MYVCMSFDKKDANGSLKNMKRRCEIAQRDKKATGMLKLKKPESQQKIIWLNICSNQVKLKMNNLLHNPQALILTFQKWQLTN